MSFFGGYIKCNGCGVERATHTKRGLATAWSMRNIAPPGWVLLRSEDADGVKRMDVCPKCKPRPAGAP